MTTTLISMAEIRREAPWALRALGYPFGVADRATPLVQWAEAVHGGALAWMRAGESEIIRSAALPAAKRARDPDGGWRIEAGGKCLVEAGPPAADLATCDVRMQGSAHVMLTGVAGLHFAGAICALIVARGHGAVCAYASGAEEIAADRFASAGWIVAVPTADGPAIHAGGPQTDSAVLAKHLAATLFASGEQEARVISDDLAAMIEHRADHPGMFALSVFSRFKVARAQGHDRPGRTDAVTDWPRRVARADIHGVVVAREDFQHLYALEERTWAPSSDRSRRQAAF